jgi:hypothetical protein
MLRDYSIPSERSGEGWALIVVNTDNGFFATVSDWGNYAYIWSSPGCEFRKFLMGLNPDYLCSKLMHGRKDAREYDSDAIRLEVMKELDERAKSYRERNRKFWPRYAEEKRNAEERLSGDNVHDFEAWCSETVLDEPWRYHLTRFNQQCMAFCTKVWPRFKKLLEEELAAEEKAKDDAEKIRAPAIAEVLAALHNEENDNGS